MNEIYKKNISSIKETLYELYDEEKYNDESSESVVCDKSMDNEKIIGYYMAGRVYYFNSMYNDNEFSKKWCDQFNCVNYQDVFIIFGTSNFRYIRDLINKLDDTNMVLVYEPSIDIFRCCIKNIDITDILQRKNVILVVKGINDRYIQFFLNDIINYSNIKLIQFRCMPNYNILFKEEEERFITVLTNRINSVIIDRNTELLFSKEVIINTLYNIDDIVEQHTINQLSGKYEELDNIESITGILVSAGPSLDKNIDELRLAKGKSVIVAVDTAMKTLLNHGIVPDFVVTVDSHKPATLFMHPMFYDVPLIVCSQSSKEVIRVHRGKRFYFADPNSFENGIYRKYKKDSILFTETGGSVANNAFSFIQMLGINRIILVGQDLAYPNNKTHSEEAYNSKEQNKLQNDKKYIEVEDVFGGKVLTEGNMNQYRIWFENQIIKYPMLHVIDATEGGALIKGTEICSLNEAINKYCTVDIDNKSIVEGINPVFNDKEKDLLKKYFDDIPEILKEKKKELQDGIDNYYEMNQLYLNKKQGEKRFKKLYDETNKLVEKMNKDELITFIGLYNIETEYDVLGNVFSMEYKTEFTDIVNKSIKMLNSYIEGIDQFLDDLQVKNKVDRENWKNAIEILKSKTDIMIDKVNGKDFESFNISLNDYYKYLLIAIDYCYIIECKEGFQRYIRLVEILKEINKNINMKEYEMFFHNAKEINKILESVEDNNEQFR